MAETSNSRTHDAVSECDGEGFYVASVPALPGCHTQARSLDALTVRIREAIAVYVDVRPDGTDMFHP